MAVGFLRHNLLDKPANYFDTPQSPGGQIGLRAASLPLGGSPFSPFGTMLYNPIGQCALKANVIAHFF